MANALGLGVRSFISNHDIILFLVFVQQYQDHQYLTGTNPVLWRSYCSLLILSQWFFPICVNRGNQYDNFNFDDQDSSGKAEMVNTLPEMFAIFVW